MGYTIYLVTACLVFVAFAFCLGFSSNLPPKGHSNRTNYQWLAAFTGIIAFGGQLGLIYDFYRVGEKGKYSTNLGSNQTVFGNVNRSLAPIKGFFR